MTANELQRQLIKEIEYLTKDMSLKDKNGKPADLKGYPQAIPVQNVFTAVPYDTDDSEEDGDELFPYFIVRMDTVEYQKKEADGANQAHLMVAFAIYDDDPELKGYFTLSAVMERVVERFQSNTEMGQFWCSRQMSLAYQEDDTYPQFFGAIEMLWNLPDISMELGMEELL